MSRTFSSNRFPRLLTQARLVAPSTTPCHPVLVDSGADESFMDIGLAERLGLDLVPLQEPLEVNALDGRLLCKITQRTSPLQLLMAENHTEEIVFHIFSSPVQPLILCLPWLVKHNPNKNWATGEVTSWGAGCAHACIRQDPVSDCPDSSVSPLPATPESPVSSPLLPSLDSDFPDLSKVPSCYLDLKEVFNKSRATALPPHRPYDCCIDLLPGTMPPRGRLYSLSAPETATMKEYIESSLAAGIIRPSSSPAFLVWTDHKNLA